MQLDSSKSNYSKERNYTGIKDACGYEDTIWHLKQPLGSFELLDSCWYPILFEPKDVGTLFL